MKKLIFLLVMLFQAPAFFSCGYSESSYIDFHKLLIGGRVQNQCNCGVDGNMDEWKAFFDHQYDDTMQAMVYKYSMDEIKQVMSKENNPLFLEAFHYLLYAKSLGKSSKRVSGRVNPFSWDYDEIKAQEVFDPDLLDQGIQGFKNSNHKELKMRYAYQVIRYLHYNSKWQEAISFFENNVPALNLKNEIYYYCLDQVSGCYYSMKEYTEAAYGFMQVIMNSRDRKESATTSFDIHYNWQFEELLEKCQSPTERILARTLLTPFKYDYQDAKWILDNEFDEQALLEIYFYHDIHEQEEYYRFVEIHEGDYAYEESLPYSKNSELIKSILKRDHLKHRDFWYSCLAYMAFFQNQFEEASNYINAIDELTIVDEKKFNFYKNLYNNFASKKVNDSVENEIHRIYMEQVRDQYEDYAMNDVFFSMVIHYYIQHDEMLKAQLMTSNKSHIDQFYDFELLNELQNLHLRKDKNEMEKFLLLNVLSGVEDINSYVIEKKASLYLMLNNHSQAKALFDQLPANYKSGIEYNYYQGIENYRFDGFSNVPKQVFSINIKEGFEFDMNLILDDQVCFQQQFDFIPKVFNKAQLNEYLIELKAMAATGNAQANYLLGNYYYNLSELGYFRNLLIYYPENNLCSSCKSNELLADYWYKSNVYYSEAKSTATDQEFLAKTTYLMAKNAAFYEEGPFNYFHHSALRSDDCYKLFDELKTTYGNTNFYDQIIEECSVFSYYVNPK